MLLFIQQLVACQLLPTIAGISGESTSTDNPDLPTVADIAVGTVVSKEPTASGPSSDSSDYRVLSNESVVEYTAKSSTSATVENTLRTAVQTNVDTMLSTSGIGNFVSIPQRLKSSATKRRRMENYNLTSSEHTESITGALKKKAKKATNRAEKKVNAVSSKKTSACST